MKRKNVILCVILCFVAIAILVVIFSYAVFKTNNMYFDTDKDFRDIVIGNNIISPDRIVYRNDAGNFFEFEKDSKSYNQIKNLLSNSIENYNESGETLTENQTDEIHDKSFIEFDYKTASKNYIIQLEKNDNRAIIKLGNTGGTVVTQTINNVNKIKNTLENLSRLEKIYKLEYYEEFSRNKLDVFEYKYQSLFKKINSQIYQVKIQNIQDYEKYKEICNIAIEKNITEEIFENNDIILTVSLIPKIETKVSVGNIKYKYDRIENVQYGYNVHILIVSKIVNTDCIYNTDFTVLENNIDNDNIKINYNQEVDNLSDSVFVIDIEKFMQEYNSSNSVITLKQAKEIAESGFKEAERICGIYEKDTQTVEEENVKPNNFFTRKLDEGDQVYQYTIPSYVFSRYDDMGNGVKIYVDKKLGMIIGGEAFGD